LTQSPARTTNTTRPRLIDFRIGNILNTWTGINFPFGGKRLELSPYLHEDELDPLREKINLCLADQGGEVSSRARAAELGKAYLGLNDEGKGKFLALLAEDYGIDHDAVRKTAQQLFSDLADKQRNKVESQLRAQLTPAHLRLLTQFNALPQGIKFLVDMRADALRLRSQHKSVQSIADVLRDQLSSWFDIGFLELRSIDWNAPAALLEKLMEYEAVHQMASWDDLRHRLSERRRCFAFFHPGMPNEPLIFVWVALTTELSDSVDTLLDSSQTEEPTAAPNTAIFYSISSAQRGLAGVSLGNFLIKRVVDELKREFTSLNTFSTLSPIPGLADWLAKKIDAAEEDFTLLTQDEQKKLDLTSQDFASLLQSADWIEDEQLRDSMSTPLRRLAARYITELAEGGNRAVDPVAHFHLSNGATVERINWNADNSDRGRKQSYTLMVNYLYDLNEIDNNHEQYVETSTIAISKAVDGLL